MFHGLSVTADRSSLQGTNQTNQSGAVRRFSMNAYALLTRYRASASAALRSFLSDLSRATALVSWTEVNLLLILVLLSAGPPENSAAFPLWSSPLD